MVESDHGEMAEDVKTTPSSVGDPETKKVDIVNKRARDDDFENDLELPIKRARSEINDTGIKVDKVSIPEAVPKANGSTEHKDDSMEIDGSEVANDNLKVSPVKSDEKIDDAESLEEKEVDDNIDESIHSDTEPDNLKSELKENAESNIEKQETMQKNDASSEDKTEEDEDEDDDIDDKADLSGKEKTLVEKSSPKASVSKSRTKDLEVVDGLEMSVECASDKDGSSSEGEQDDDEKKKPRPKTIIVKAKPNDSELDASTSEGEKSDGEEDDDDNKNKTSVGGKKSLPEGKGRKKGKKKGFGAVNSSASEDSDDNGSEDEDYSPRTKKKMKKALAAKKALNKTPGKKRGRKPKKLVKKSDEEQSGPEENDEVNLDERSKKNKEKNQKSASGSEDEEKTDDDANESTPKNGKKRSKARPEDDRRIQSLKKYLKLAGIKISSYEKFWAGCNSNTARLGRMKEALAKQGVVGRPTLEKCKKAKAKMELLQDAASLGPVEDINEGRITRARGVKKTASPKADTPRKEARGGYKRVQSVIDSESE